MTRKTPLVIIADSSRLGTHMLEKILAPLVELRCCHTDGDLHDGLSLDPAACLISNQWPGLERVIEETVRSRPDLRLILLASPESDARRLAQLCEHFQASLLYRPYQPNQVIRELLQRLADGDTVEREPMSLAPTDIAGPELVMRDMAFCKRHGMPLSLLALRIEDYAALSMELGEEALKSLELALLHAISEKLRREDSVCFHRPGAMAFSLPGTPPLGARVLAHRLREQLANEGVSVGGFQVHATLVAGIHCPAAQQEQDAQAIIDSALKTAGEAVSADEESMVQFSDGAAGYLEPRPQPTAGHQSEPLPAAQHETAAIPDPDQLWISLGEILTSSADQSGSPREAVLKKLVQALARLDENERMTLVDELLMASARID